VTSHECELSAQSNEQGESREMAGDANAVTCDWSGSWTVHEHRPWWVGMLLAKR
jgi:uncharacterized cupin superfamily protein